MEETLSILAIIISIGTVVVEIVKDRRSDRTTLEAHYYDDIFSEYLIAKIPNARKSLQFIGTRMHNDYRNLCDVLGELRTNSFYFYFRKPQFHKQLIDKLVKLDECLVEQGARCIPVEDQASVLQDIDEQLNEIYNLIFSNYIGTH